MQFEWTGYESLHSFCQCNFGTEISQCGAGTQRLRVEASVVYSLPKGSRERPGIQRIPVSGAGFQACPICDWNHTDV